ncbi:MAG: hypothetical protein HY257_05980, partial [Chloroflexi bacterium]|nr:hypothetical protein [Chloroflexota bacterium]
LGPRTFEEWRADSSWGDYLFIASGQYVPPDASVQTLYRAGASAVVAKPRAASEKNRAALGMFGDTFRFLNYQIPLSAFHPGETLSVVAQIEPRRVPPRSVVWRLQLRDREHNAGAEARLAPFENKFPMQRWSPGKILTDTLVLPLSPELRPGLYDLQLGLYRVQTGDALPFVSADEKQDDVFQLGQVKIIQPEIPDHYLGALEPIDARVGDFATLRGARVQKQSPLVPGAEIRVELFWRAEQRVATDYTIFAQLLDARGNLIAQRDSAPRAGTYPTLIWDAGETIADAYALTIPRDAAPGAYQIIVGMYHWQTLQRLPITDQTGRALGDHIVLPFELQIRPYSQ